MDEQQLVAVAVAHERAHLVREFPEPHFGRGVPQHHRRIPGRGLRFVQAVEIERARAQRTFEVRPARGRARVMKERRRPEEAFLRSLALVRAVRHVGVRLT